MMKVVYLLPGGLFNSGGMERVITVKANYLVEKAGIEVAIVTTEQMGRPVFYPLSDKVRLHHLNIGIHENFGKESYLQKCVSRYRKIKEYRQKLTTLLEQIRPDITISTLGLDIEFINDLKDGSVKIGELHFPGNFRELMARKLSNDWLSNFIAQRRTIALRKQCARLAQLVVLTHEEKSSWKNQHNISVIPNPLPFFPEQTSPCTSKQAIAVGRLVYEKGFDQLIEVWEKFAANYPDWKLSIYGDGDQKDLLRQRIKDRGLEKQVKIYPPVVDIYAKYMDSSLLVFPSRYLDALPMVLIEALSCGLPLVAFDAPCGPKDVIVNEENGFLVPAGDVNALSEKIQTLLASEALRQTMGKAARASSERYRLEPVMDQWLNLFKQVNG
ncbi:MAG: glycosyltransferase family 4 protein [Dysgonamonadaceae bacterium]|jgi:glycosyltransferase involved in cell wall biosynthesis|nr:glycosyltransferase family 4 protein [Dysgonamonadaceae bacterium]